MKLKNRTISLILLVLCGIILCTLNVSAASKVAGDKENTAYIGTIEIDGQIDDVWNLVPEIPVDIIKENASLYFGNTSKTAGVDYAKLTIKTLWNPSKRELYILYVVEDKVISLIGGNDWTKDSIELFIDEDNIRDGVFDLNSHQIRVLAREERTDQLLWSAEVVMTDNGYIVEMLYAFEESVQAGDWIGIDFQANDDAVGDGNRHVCLGWSDSIDKASSDTTVWGQMYLSNEKAEDVFAIEEEIIEIVPEQAAEISVSEIVSAPIAEIKAPATSDYSNYLVIFILSGISALSIGITCIRRKMYEKS